MNSVIQQRKINYLNWPLVLFTLLVFSLLIKLGLWQSDRALEKQLRQQRIAKLNQQKPLSLAQVLTISTNKSLTDGINDLPIQLVGRFDPEVLFFLDNQPNKGRLGYRVLQVFYSEKQPILVNLGWVQGSITRSELPDISPIIGDHTLLGHVRTVDVGILLMEQQFSDNNWPLRVQQIELDKFSTLIGDKLLPFVIYLDKNEPLGYQKNWQPIVMPAEKHQGYAFQWFSLAIAWLVLMIWAAIKMKQTKTVTTK